MINLKEYLSVSEEKNKFDLPLNFFGHVKYLIILKFLENLPFLENLFIDEEKIKKYYWQIIISHIKKEFDADFYITKSNFKDRFLQYSANFFHAEGSDFLKNIKGHGNTVGDEDVAISKALGEYLERYMTCFLDDVQKKNIRKMSYGEIKKQAKTVREYHGFNENQLQNDPNLKIEDVDIFEVLPVDDLINNKKVFYPVKQVLWNNHFHTEKIIANITTSGSAGGFTVDQSSLNALYEVIERDSFFCYWLTKTIPKKIILEPGEIVEYDRLKKILNEIGYDVYVLDITTDLNIASVVFLVLDRETKGICISGGADINLGDAIKKAVNEAYSCVSIFLKDAEYNIEKNFIPFTQKGLYRNERLLMWKDGRYFEHISYILEGEEIKFKDTKQKENIFVSEKFEFDYLINILKEKGYSDIYRFISSDKRLQLFGYSVVRMIIPKMYQLYLNEAQALTKSSRIDDFSVRKIGKKDWVINTWPHPFP